MYKHADTETFSRAARKRHAFKGGCYKTIKQQDVMKVAMQFRADLETWFHLQS